MRKVGYIFFLIIILAACNQNNTKPHNNNIDVLPEGVSVRDSHINMKNNTAYTDEEKAQHLSNLVSNIPNVNGATAVVIGNFAMVGIDVNANLDRSKVGSVKYTVTESLKHDPHGANAIVVADPDLYARLQEVRLDTQEGRPIEGIMNELSDIAGRLMPDLPPKESGKNPEDAQERQKDELNNNDRRELDKEQRDQSNQQK